MSRTEKLKNAEDYRSIIVKEFEYYGPLAREVDVSLDILEQAATLAIQDAIYRHRENPECKYREEECVTWNIRHFVDLTLVRACLLASSDEEMAKAEEVLMKLIED